MPDHFYAKAGSIDDLINQGASAERLGQIVSTVNGDEALERYFLGRIESASWSSYLYEKGFFNSEKNPAPKEDSDNPGYFVLPTWPALEYLQRVSEQLFREGNGDAAAMVLGIMRQVTDDAKGVEPYPNPRTWTGFARLLAKMPMDHVEADDLAMVREWLGGPVDFTPLHQELTHGLMRHVLGSKSPNKVAALLSAITGIKKTGAKDRYEGRYDTIVDKYWLGEGLVVRSQAFEAGKIIGREDVLELANRIDRVLPSGHPFPLPDPKDRRVTFRIERMGDGPVRLGWAEGDSVESESEEQLEWIASEEPCRDFKDFLSYWQAHVRPHPEVGWIDESLDPMLLLLEWQDDQSTIWLESLENIQTANLYSAKEVLSGVLLQATRGYVHAHGVDAADLLRALLPTSIRPQVCARIALKCIDENWEVYKDLFWELIGSEIGPYCMSVTGLGVSIRAVIANRRESFSDDEAEKIKGLIEDGPKDHPVMRRDDRYKERWRDEWTASLEGETNEDQDLGTSRGARAFRVEHESPLTMDQFNDMTNEKLAQFSKKLVSKPGFTFEGPDAIGLANQFRAVAASEPDRFVSNLDPFVDLPYVYCHYLLWGLKDAWKNDVPFDWGKLLGFLQHYCGSKRFGLEELERENDPYGHKYWSVLSEIGWLVQDATENDDSAMPEEHNDTCVGLLGDLIDRYVIAGELPDESGADNDPVTDALNSTAGRLIAASLYLALRIARLSRVDEGTEAGPDRWTPRLKEVFVRTCEQRIRESIVFLGQYMPQLIYLDAELVWSEVGKLAKESEENWYPFMYGYLFGNTRYANLYPRMTKHYRRALEEKVGVQRFREMLVDHIAFGYMANLEEFDLSDGSLLRRVLDEGQADDLKRLVQLFASKPKYDHSKEDPEESLPFRKIIDLWRNLHGKYKKADEGSLTKDDKEVLSEMARLTIWIPQLDEEYANLVLQVAPHVHASFNAHWFLEHLGYQLGRGTPATTAKYLSQILDRMTDSGLPYGEDEQVEKIVKFIYANGDDDSKKRADVIVERFAESGQHFLRGLWVEYGQDR